MLKHFVSCLLSPIDIVYVYSKCWTHTQTFGENACSVAAYKQIFCTFHIVKCKGGTKFGTIIVNISETSTDSYNLCLLSIFGH